VLKYVCPVIAVIATFVIWGSLAVFGADVEAADGNLVTAGYAMQCLLISVLVRELVIAGYECCRGRLMHY